MKYLALVSHSESPSFTFHPNQSRTIIPTVTSRLGIGSIVATRRTSRNSLWPNEHGFSSGESYNTAGNGEEESSRYWRNGPCTCWNTTDGSGTREVECKCSGPDMSRLTTALHSDVHRL
jgi:hypothetical protein